jgi:hypothetical protein
VTDAPNPEPGRYSLSFLTDQWQWESALAADTLEQARTLARDRLEALVQEENPRLACVYLLDEDQKIGVWDWVERRSYWTPL